MFGEDEAGHASMARYEYLTAGCWKERYKIRAFVWPVPPNDYREHYLDVYALSLVKGCEGEIADVDTDL